MVIISINEKGKGERPMSTENKKKRELAALLAAECKTTGDIQSLLKNLFAGAVEQILEAEIEEHLGYEKHAVIGNNSGNSRNGHNKKKIQSEYGESEIMVPRDRCGSFEPQIIEKRQTRTDEIEDKVLCMYAKGMTTRDIEDSLRDIYGAEVSASLISRITDKILPEVNEWQNRPLSDIYPVIFFDGIVFKSRKDNKIINKCVYTVLGIDMDGQKDILGIWISENESASFWASICNDLRNRGVRDILIACHDNLKGLSNAINATFTQCSQQLCVVHQIRSSTKFVPWKDRKAVCADLKRIYGAVNLDDAEYAREEFREKWDSKYPSILKSWDANWAELVTFFQFSAEIRKLIYTTNAVEGFHRMLRKYTKVKTIFPTDDSIKKVVFLTVKEISKKWTQSIRDWGLIYGQLVLHFEERLAA
jgi:putative transposase